jgi:hypothetical protein
MLCDGAIVAFTVCALDMRKVIAVFVSKSISKRVFDRMQCQDTPAKVNGAASDTPF